MKSTTIFYVSSFILLALSGTACQKSFQILPLVPPDPTPVLGVSSTPTLVAPASPTAAPASRAFAIVFPATPPSAVVPPTATPIPPSPTWTGTPSVTFTVPTATQTSMAPTSTSSSTPIPPSPTRTGTPTVTSTPFPSGQVLTGTNANFKQILAGSSLPVVLEFWASWCGTCVYYSPVVTQFAKDYAGQVLVVRVNADQNMA